MKNARLSEHTFDSQRDHLRHWHSDSWESMPSTHHASILCSSTSTENPGFHASVEKVLKVAKWDTLKTWAVCMWLKASEVLKRSTTTIHDSVAAHDTIPTIPHLNLDAFPASVGHVLLGSSDERLQLFRNDVSRRTRATCPWRSRTLSATRRVFKSIVLHTVVIKAQAIDTGLPRRSTPPVSTVNASHPSSSAACVERDEVRTNYRGAAVSPQLCP